MQIRGLSFTITRPYMPHDPPGSPILTLALFKLRIFFVDYVQSSFATNDLAVGRTFFD